MTNSYELVALAMAGLHDAIDQNMNRMRPEDLSGLYVALEVIDRVRIKYDELAQMVARTDLAP